MLPVGGAWQASSLRRRTSSATRPGVACYRSHLPAPCGSCRPPLVRWHEPKATRRPVAGLPFFSHFRPVSELNPPAHALLGQFSRRVPPGLCHRAARIDELRQDVVRPVRLGSQWRYIQQIAARHWWSFHATSALERAAYLQSSVVQRDVR